MYDFTRIFYRFKFLFFLCEYSQTGCHLKIEEAIRNKALLLLGSNKGLKEKQLSDAAVQLEEKAGKIVKHSSVYKTAAWGNTNQPDFLNMAVEIETVKNAHELLASILDIEKRMGRKRNGKWQARIIDIDILFFNNEIIETDKLVIPHPFIQERRFTLVPLNEIAENYVHPVYRKTIGELLKYCHDKLEVVKYRL